jgi:hypothetical protein
MRGLSRHYRPEMHYMRGPGPMWREKNTEPATSFSDQRFVLPSSSWLIPATTALLVLIVTALALS